MIIAHGPAGYLVGAAAAGVRRRLDLVAAGVFGGLFPDIDAVGYHLGIFVGFHRATPLHWPSVWIAALLIGLAMMVLRRRPGEILAVFAASGLVHCGLDMTMAPLYWAAPFHWETYELVHVPGGWSPYWLGFFFYWTFLPEIAIWIAALWVWRGRRARYGRVADEGAERHPA